VGATHGTSVVDAARYRSGYPSDTLVCEDNQHLDPQGIGMLKAMLVSGGPRSLSFADVLLQVPTSVPVSAIVSRPFIKLSGSAF
jgi:hypothetical protein